jgi:hypothetical protein
MVTLRQHRIGDGSLAVFRTGEKKKKKKKNNNNTYGILLCILRLLEIVQHPILTCSYKGQLHTERTTRCPVRRYGKLTNSLLPKFVFYLKPPDMVVEVG